MFNSIWHMCKNGFNVTAAFHRSHTHERVRGYLKLLRIVTCLFFALKCWWALKVTIACLKRGRTEIDLYVVVVFLNRRIFSRKSLCIGNKEGRREIIPVHTVTTDSGNEFFVPGTAPDLDSNKQRENVFSHLQYI